MKAGSLVRDLEYDDLFLGIILYKMKPTYWYPEEDRWFVQWFDGDSYDLDSCNMEVVSEGQ